MMICIFCLKLLDMTSRTLYTFFCLNMFAGVKWFILARLCINLLVTEVTDYNLNSAWTTKTYLSMSILLYLTTSLSEKATTSSFLNTPAVIFALFRWLAGRTRSYSKTSTIQKTAIEGLEKQNWSSGLAFRSREREPLRIYSFLVNGYWFHYFQSSASGK